MLNYAIRHLKKYGYSSIPNFFSHNECEMLKYRASELISQSQDEIKNCKSIFNTKKQQKSIVQDAYFMDSSNRVSFFLEDTSNGLHVNKMGHGLHDVDKVFNQFCYQPRIKDLSRKIGFQQPQIVQTMYIFKNPYIGGEVSPHCDNQFLMSDPLSVHGFWIALSDATVENGCLWGIPESHLKNPTHFFRKQSSIIKDQSGVCCWDNGHDSNKYDLSKGVPIEANKGTLVILHGNFIHYSSTNESPNSREALTIHVSEGIYDWRSDNWLSKEFRKWD